MDLGCNRRAHIQDNGPIPVTAYARTTSPPATGSEPVVTLHCLIHRDVWERWPSPFRVIRGRRLTGDGKYTDKVELTLTDGSSASGAMCHVNACSESQSNSFTDYSTNFCNLFDLVNSLTSRPSPHPPSLLPPPVRRSASPIPKQPTAPAVRASRLSFPPPPAYFLQIWATPFGFLLLKPSAYFLVGPPSFLFFSSTPSSPSPSSPGQMCGSANHCCHVLHDLEAVRALDVGNQGDCTQNTQSNCLKNNLC